MDVNTFKEPTTLTGIASGIIVLLLMNFAANANITLSIITAFLFGGFVYLIYNDFEQRKKLRELEAKKEDNRIHKISEQRNKDLEKKVCVSCTKDVDSLDTACKHCGFDLTSIKID